MALRKAFGYAEQAVKTDPDFAPALALLAATYWERSTFGFGILPNEEAFRKARVAAAKALEIDEALAEPHVVMGQVLCFRDWDWAGADREFKQAIELNPSFYDAHSGYCWCLMAMGRRNESIREAKRAVEFDPVSARSYHSMSAMYYLTRQYDQAIEQIRKWLDLYPNSSSAYFWLFQAYLAKGMNDEAIASLAKDMALRGRSPAEVAAMEHTYKVDGMRGFWRWRLHHNPTRKSLDPYEIAASYARLGEKDQAIAWLEKMYQEHDPGTALIRVDPSLDTLRTDPRFHDLLRRMNFPK